MNEIQLKSLSKGAVVDVDTTKKIVVGYFAKFEDEPDSDGDIIARGAFTKTLAMNGPQSGNRIWHLWNHNLSEPINKPYLLAEDASGLRFETKFPDTTVGRDKLTLYQEGAITEHSFGFNVINNEMKGGFNYLTELRMWEGSSVLWGANKNSNTVGLKSDEFALKTNILESLLRNGTLSDETFRMIEKLLKDIQAIFMEYKYPNEHSARMIPPEDMEPPYYRHNIAKGVDIVVGTMKDGSGRKTQAYRFNATKYDNPKSEFQSKVFNVTEAKQWCKDNKVDYILFTPAGKALDSQADFIEADYTKDATGITEAEAKSMFYKLIFKQ